MQCSVGGLHSVDTGHLKRVSYELLKIFNDIFKGGHSLVMSCLKYKSHFILMSQETLLRQTGDIH